MRMRWSEEIKPNEKSNYDHVFCDTPLGEIIIEWKSWKDMPSYDISMDGIWIGCKYSLIDAKYFSFYHLEEISNELNRFINSSGLDNIEFVD